LLDIVSSAPRGGTTADSDPGWNDSETTAGGCRLERDSPEWTSPRRRHARIETGTDRGPKAAHAATTPVSVVAVCGSQWQVFPARQADWAQPDDRSRMMIRGPSSRPRGAGQYSSGHPIRRI